MTFKHKLSMRLARMRSVLMLLPAALIFACTVGDQSLSGPTQPNSLAMASTPGTVLFQENFDDNAFAGRGWYDNTAMAITDTTNVPGGTHALEVHFPAGATNPTWGGAARHLFTPSPTLYVSYWVRYSANWVGSGRTYHPHEFYVLSDQDGDYDGPSNNWLTLYLEDSYQNGGIPRLAMQDNKAINTSYGALPRNLIGVTENRSTGGCNGVMEAQIGSECYNAPPWYNDKKIDAAQPYFLATPGPGYKGNWNHVEAYFQLNSIAGGIGQADGVMQYWFNGTPVIDRHDILFRTGARPNINFHQFIIAPYIGDGSPVNQYMWVDNLVVATAPLTSAATVASVTVSPASATAAVGGTAQFAATLKDAAGNVLSGQPVAWTSGNAGVASVNANGLASALTAGTATISATSGGITGSAALTATAIVTNPGTVTNLSTTAATDTSVTLSFTEVNDGTGLPASYDIRFAAGSMGWGSAATAARGTCAAPMAGTTIGATRTCTLLGLAASTAYQFQLVAYRGTLNLNAVFGALSNVASRTTTTPVASVATVSLTPVSATLGVGGTQLFTATLKDVAGTVLTGRTVTWASSNTAVATLSGATATAVAAGTATISATSGGVIGSATVTVSAIAPVASVTVAPATVSQAVGATTQLAATLTDASGAVLTGRTLTWSSSNPAVATVSASGLEKGITSGSATITATSEGRSGTAAITVTASKPGTVSTLSVSGTTTSSATLSFTEVGDGTGRPASYEVRAAAGTMAWGSAADVTQGTCTVPVVGTTIGAKRTCTVLGLAPATRYQFEVVALRGTLNVNAVFGALSNVATGTTVNSTAAVASVAVSPASATLSVGGTQQLSATLKDASGNTLTGRTVTWASSNVLMATVSGSGVATGVATGPATVSASSEGMSGSSALTIAVAPPPPPPPPPPPSGLFTHEPAGLSVIQETDWSTGMGTWFQKFISADKPITIVPITDSPLGDAQALQIGYLAGSVGGGGTELEYDIPGTRPNELFVGYYVQVDPTWQGHLSAINKMVYLEDDPAGFSAMWYEMFGSGSESLSLYVVNQSGSGPAGIHENGTPVNFTRGQWHKVEIYQKQGQPGIVRVWVDGVLAIDRSDVYTRAAPIASVSISGIWGGVGDVKQHYDFMRFDHVRISGR